MNENWVCPHCQHATTINDLNRTSDKVDLRKWNRSGYKSLFVKFIVCPNPNCNEYSLFVELWNTTIDSKTDKTKFTRMLKRLQIVPNSKAKTFPDYIPVALREDYTEAMTILEDSPKASATLARRCLQGMIRDYWNIKDKNNLYQEIDAIRDKVDPIIWQAIDSVREIGNIGAHMKKDVNLIVKLEPKEAEILLSLIEMLFKEWYIARFNRELQLKEIIDLREEKKNH